MMGYSYNELDMYDTNVGTYGKKYGDHKLGLESNSKGIKVVKCTQCHIARLFLMGHDITACHGDI
jgi:hypothetical protein